MPSVKLPVSTYAATTRWVDDLAHPKSAHPKPHKKTSPIHEFAPDVIEAGLEPTLPSVDTGKVLNTLRNQSNTLWFAADLAPIIAGAALGGVGLMGKATGKIGGLVAGNPSLGSPLVERSVDWKNAIANNYTNRPLKTTELGASYAGFVDRLATPFYGALAGINSITGGVFESRARSIMAKASMHAANAQQQAEGLVSKLPEALAAKLQGFVAAACNHDHGAMESCSGELHELMHDHALDKETTKAIKNTMKAAEKHVYTVEKAHGWERLANGEHNTLEKVGKASIQRGVANTMLGVTSVAATTITAMDIASDLGAFKSMVADIKGIDAKDVTYGDAFMGELPYAGMVGRHAIMKSAPPRILLEGMQQIFNFKMFKGNHRNMMLYMLPTIIGSQAIGMFTSGNVLDVYKEMKRNELAGRYNSSEDYCKLIGMTHKELSHRQGGESHFAKEVGRIYSENHISLRQTLADVQNGKIDQLIQHIIETNSAEKQAAASQAEIQAETPSPVMHEVSMIHPNQHTEQSLSLPQPQATHTAPQMAPLPASFAQRLSQQPTQLTEATRA